MEHKCWSCEAPTQGAAFCPACGKIAPLRPGVTHFEVFGLPPSVELDLPALEKQFRELSLKLHPDRFAQATAKERRISLEQTTALNDAYKTLRDPVRRGLYLLKLRGIDLGREDAGAQKDMPLEFLEEVMELREALDGAREAKDVAAAQRMGDDVSQKSKAATEAAFAALRKVYGPEGEQGAALREASFQLGRVRYFQRFLEEVSAIEEEALG